MSAAPHSTYDLTTFCRKTTGDVPPKLVVSLVQSLDAVVLNTDSLKGAATAVLGSEMYLFGGRLFAERRMVADLYVFDLETYNWQIIPAFPEDDVPCPRYFHSLETWNNHLILFGGMTDEPGSPDEYRVLNDIRLFDIESLHWLQPSRFRTPESLLPQARYAHLASVTADRLFIIGGQDYYNIWLTDVCVYDLITQTWSETRDHPVHCGSYRSIAVSSSQVVRFPEVELPDGRDSPVLCQGDLSSPSLVHLLYSAAPDNDYPSNIYLYSNRNFTQVKRELEVLSPLPNTGFTLQDLSSSFAGAQLPPGLRFPSGAIQGSHLIVSGIVIAKSDHAFSIWALDLKTMHWSHIDPGNALDVGSWVRGCLHADENKLIIFGNRAGNFVEDFTCRILSWDHVAVVDLEAFGIYQPPALKLDIHMQELGLAALNKRALADFDIICDDGRTLVCSRKLLEERRPWFKEMRLKLLQDAMSGLQVDSPTTDRGILDLRLTPRALHLPEQYPIAMALVQYFYTLALVTPLQTAPAVLSQLLILSTNYQLPHLQGLVRHAMHRALSYRTCTGVYEVATLCECRSLQIRAMRILMVSTRREEESPHSETAVAGEHSNHTYHIARIADNEAHAGPSTRPRSTARERRENHVFDLRAELPPIPFVDHQQPLREKRSANFDSQWHVRRDMPTNYNGHDGLRVEERRPHPRIQTTATSYPGCTTSLPDSESAFDSATTPESDSYFSSRRQLIGSMTPSLIFSSTGSSQAESPGPRTPSQDQFWLPGIVERYTDVEDTDGVQWLEGELHVKRVPQGETTAGIPVRAQDVTTTPENSPTSQHDHGRASSPMSSPIKVGRLWRRKNSSADQVSSSGENSKQQKAEEKKLKKEAAKARTEELARALRERAHVRAEEAEAGTGTRIDRVSNLGEPAAFFGGIARGGLTM